MIDPAIQEFSSRFWWFLPTAFFVGLLVVYLERKIGEYNKNKRNKNK